MTPVKNPRLANVLFMLICAAILLVLIKAPRETTPKVPDDAQHNRLLHLKNKQEAEKSCGDCHGSAGPVPLSKDHPPKFRCLLCHKTR